MNLDSTQTVARNKKIKLLFVTTGLGSGGAEVMLCSLLSRINRNYFEPTVISLMDKGLFGGQIEQLDIPVHCVGMLPGKTSSWFDLLCRSEKQTLQIREKEETLQIRETPHLRNTVDFVVYY